MLPGMTGLAQVIGNIYLDLRERYKLDVYYVDHISLAFDIKVIFCTVSAVLNRSGVHENTQATENPAMRLFIFCSRLMEIAELLQDILWSRKLFKIIKMNIHFFIN